MADITIVGTGAMALYFGGRLASAGENVCFLGTWPEGLDVINQKGICVVSDKGERYFPAEATSDPEKITSSRLAIVLVKSWQSKRTANQLANVLDADGIVLTLQNGLGNAEVLAAELGEDRVAQGVTTYGATVLGPGRVHPGGEGMVTVQQHGRLAPLIQSFRKSGLKIQEVPDISGIMWEKLIINVAINPLTGLLGVKNGKLLESSAATKIMGLAAREAEEVARALGIRIKMEDPGQAAESVAAATGENLSSMLQDIRRGAPTEIDALCGAVVRSGRSVDIPTPVNKLLMLLIQARGDLTRIS